MSGYVVYSESKARDGAIALLQAESDERDGWEPWTPSVTGGFVCRFDRSWPQGGSAQWGQRCDARVWRDLATAIAVALVVSDHFQVHGAVVLDAETLEPVG